jgi:hypothetical protein
MKSYGPSAPAVFSSLARQETALEARLAHLVEDMEVALAADDDGAYERAEAEHDAAGDELDDIKTRLDWFDEYGEARR